MEKTFNKESVRELIVNSRMFQDFVHGNKGYMNVTLWNIPVAICKESIGGSYYYRVPYNASLKYEELAEFMEVAIPVLSELIEEQRVKDLLV